MSEPKFKPEILKTETLESVMAKLRVEIDRIAEYFSEQETGDRLKTELQERLPSHLDNDELIAILEEMKSLAIRNKSLTAGLLLNLINAVKRRR